MKVFENHIYGIKMTFETLAKGKLWLFFVPGLAVGLMFFSILSVTAGVEETSKGLFGDIWFVGDWIETGIGWIFDFVEMVLFWIIQFVVLTLLSPFNSLLSEKFDAEISGREYKTSFIQILNDLLRAIFVAFIAIVLEVTFLLGWLLLSFILPGSDYLDPIMYFLIGAFFFGFAFYDYSLERHGVSTLGSIGFSFSKMSYMLVTGSIFQLIFMIPYVGLFIAPVLATFIATGAYVKLTYAPPKPEPVAEPAPPTETID
ncbi:MAG TPA: EI24 domain-containing protein [Fluviicola sp.]|nr:EI24 domain-containing protein [Fluviicola sp.]